MALVVLSPLLLFLVLLFVALLGFVDLFDLCHAMTYTVMDQQGRHSSEKIDSDMVQAAF